MKKFFKSIIVIQMFFILFNICSLQCFGANNTENEQDLFLKNEITINNHSKKTPTSPTSKNNFERTTEFKFLLDYGYPEDFLKIFPNTTLENIIKLLESNTIARFETKTEYWPNDSEQNAKVKITTLVANLQDNQTMKNTGSTVCVYWEWINGGPIFRGKDFISINWNKKNFCFTPDSFYAEDYWRKSTSDNWCVSNSYTTLSRLNLNSLGHWTDLKEFKNQVGGVAIFKLSPTNSDINTDNVIDDLRIFYNHDFDFIVTLTIVIITFIIVVRFRLKKKRK